MMNKKETSIFAPLLKMGREENIEEEIYELEQRLNELRAKQKLKNVA